MSVLEKRLQEKVEESEELQLQAKKLREVADNAIRSKEEVLHKHKASTTTTSSSKKTSMLSLEEVVQLEQVTNVVVIVVLLVVLC